MSLISIRLSGVIGIGLLLIFTGCSGRDRRIPFPANPLKEGDLVFRRGAGLASRAVLTADKRGGYSHVGIVVNDGRGLKVVHAVPGETESPDKPDCLKMEPIETFFARNRAISGAVMRVKADSAVLSAAAGLAMKMYYRHILFDHNYNKDDTTEMYCSELVEFVYCRSGLDLVEGKYSRISFPGFSGLYILPSDIQYSRYVKLIDRF